MTIRRATTVNRADTARLGSASPPSNLRSTKGRQACGVIRNRGRDQSVIAHPMFSRGNAEGEFLEPLVRFTRGDVRETISPHPKLITGQRSGIEKRSSSGDTQRSTPRDF